MSKVAIVGYARTPIGAFQGALSSFSASKLGAHAIKGAVQRAGVKPEDVEAVYMGNVLSAGVGQAPARQASIYAGLPNSVRTVTLNKVCGSGSQAVIFGAREILLGEADIVVAGGQESMTNAPYLLTKARGGYRMGNGEVIDSMIYDGLWDPYDNMHMGNCGELCADKYNFTRADQDAFAVESVKRAKAALEKGSFKDEIVPIEMEVKGQKTVIDSDEGIAAAKPDKIPGLKAAFKKDGTVTAANASSINDGAAVLVLASEKAVKEKGLKVVAWIHSWAAHAMEPKWFTIAPVGAMQKALDKAGKKVSDIDLFEVNEAFAVVTMAAMKDLNLPHEKVNVRGGACVLGHPIGASGARIIVTLMSALKEQNKKWGQTGMRIGGGEARSLVIEMA